MPSNERAPDFAALLSALADGGVRFIVIGGLAAIVHGAARTTVDLDIVYERSDDNLVPQGETMSRIEHMP